MATEAPVNLAPPEHSTVVGTSADSFIWQPSSLRMHVIRPKSAKGRKRPNLHRPQGVGDGSPSVLSTSSPPRSSGSSSSQKTGACAPSNQKTGSCAPSNQKTGACAPSSQKTGACAPSSQKTGACAPSSQKTGACAPVSPSQGAADEMSELLPQVLIGATSSLNKYPVLPSINRRSLEDGAVDTVARKASSLQLSSVQALYQEETCTTVKSSQEDSQAQVCALEKKFIIRTKRQSSSGSSNMEEPTDQEPRLLLAIRSPSGQRFVRYFRPSDNLQTVLEVAEQENKATYQHCSIETMEVPRRRFSDLTKSLQECGILHKSVLGISQEEGEG